MDLYHYRVVVYTHCQHTFQFKQLVKVHVASDDPFKGITALTVTADPFGIFISCFCYLKTKSFESLWLNSQDVNFFFFS